MNSILINLFAIIRVLTISIVAFLWADAGYAQLAYDVRVEVISAGEKYADSPRLAADPWGMLHVAYAAWLGDEPLPADGKSHFNTIMYTYNQDGKWSSPVDILVPPNPGEMGVVVNTVLVDPRARRLFILWRSDSGLYLSSAPIFEATSARSWQTQRLSADTSYWGSLAVDLSRNTMHVIYDSDFRQIYHILSRDNGSSWSAPRLVTSAPHERVAFSGSRLVIDHHGYLHAVWDENAAYRNWTADAVWYARSEDEGENWTIVEMARSAPDQNSTGGINIGFGTGDDVFLIWNRGAGSDDGRYYRRSLDSGVTWSNAQEIWPNTPDLKGGQAGWSFPLLDGDGNLYLVTSIEDVRAAAEGISNSLRFAKWSGQDWGPSTYLTTCEFPDATVSQGNLLHIVCPTFDGSERIKYIRIETDAKPVPPLPYPTVFPALTSETEKSSTLQGRQPTPTIQLKQSPIVAMPLMSNKRLPTHFTTITILFLAIVCSSVLIMSVVLWNLRKH